MPIGSSAVLLPGVTIGDGRGGLVTRRRGRVMVVGNPACLFAARAP